MRNMIIATTCLCLYLSIPCYSEEKENGISYSREVIDWSLSGIALGGALLLDKTKPWPGHPLIGGVTDRPYHDATIDGIYVYGSIAVMTGFICLVPNRNGFFNRTSYINTKAYIQAVAFTSFTTSLTKNVFGRKRPSYDNFPAKERENDGRKSFLSGHSSVSFCTATYGSMFIYSSVGDRNNPWQLAGKITAAIGLHTLAGYVAWTRVNDNWHHTSDVVAGSLTGSAIGAAVFLWHNGLDSILPSSEKVSLGVVSTEDMNGLSVSSTL